MGTGGYDLINAMRRVTGGLQYGMGVHGKSSRIIMDPVMGIPSYKRTQQVCIEQKRNSVGCTNGLQPGEALLIDFRSCAFFTKLHRGYAPLDRLLHNPRQRVRLSARIICD